jgi:hypothetical protein
MIAAKICVALMLVTMAASFSVQDAWKDLMVINKLIQVMIQHM